MWKIFKGWIIMEGGKILFYGDVYMGWKINKFVYVSYLGVILYLI